MKEAYIGTIKIQPQKWEIELGVDTNINIDGQEYRRAGKVVWGARSIRGNDERAHGSAVYVKK